MMRPASRDFDCIDCGAAASWMVAPPSQRCAGCLWLVQTPFRTAEERAEMRAHMLTHGIIGPTDDVARIRCPVCDAVSYHPEDVAHRYCGRCHRFFDAAEPSAGAP